MKHLGETIYAFVRGIRTAKRDAQGNLLCVRCGGIADPAGQHAIGIVCEPCDEKLAESEGRCYVVVAFQHGPCPVHDVTAYGMHARKGDPATFRVNTRGIIQHIVIGRHAPGAVVRSIRLVETEFLDGETPAECFGLREPPLDMSTVVGPDDLLTVEVAPDLRRVN